MDQPEHGKSRTRLTSTNAGNRVVARRGTLFGAGLLTSPKPTTEGLVFGILLYDLAAVHAMNIMRRIAGGYLHAGA